MVAAHKEFPMPENKDLYMPVLVGAAKNYKEEIDYQRDDEGENISLKNPNFNELTAVYWAWKNLDADAIGLVHYRRLFSKGGKRELDNILNKEQIEQLLDRAPIVLPKKRKYYIESNYSHYVHAHHKEPLDETRKVIQKNYPKYLNAFDLVMKQKSAHMFNMFIMKNKEFKQYANWLFDVLFEVKKNVNISEYSVQEARVFGYISELLLDVWIETNNKRYIETNWIQIGNRKLILKALNFLKRKFSSSSEKKTHF
ncbi:lipopolysaccharide biosynthesis glycosyltransferase [Pediococcus pentosaceus]|nr:lipopolysaccharide biosynthesis glycosyltransferase [Pediococcus pentosaceus]